MLHALSKLGRLDEARHEAVKYVEKNGSPRIDAWRWLTDASELLEALTRAGLAPEGAS